MCQRAGPIQEVEMTLGRRKEAKGCLILPGDPLTEVLLSASRLILTNTGGTGNTQVFVGFREKLTKNYCLYSSN